MDKSLVLLSFQLRLWLFRMTKNNIPSTGLWGIRKYFDEVEVSELNPKTMNTIKSIEEQMNNEVVRILG